MRGFLIYVEKDLNENGYFAQSMIDNCAKREVHVVLCVLKSVDNGDLREFFDAMARNFDLLDLGFVINRTRSYKVGEFFEKRGVRVFNSSRLTKTANDKYLSYALANECGLPYADCCLIDRNRLEFRQLIFPVILKEPDGHGGDGLYLCRNEFEFFENMRQMHSERFVAQNYLEGFYDVRLYVLGGKYVAALKRTSVLGEFRSNVKAGGTAELIRPKRALIKMADKLKIELSGDYYSLDFLANDNDEYYFNEIEDAVGSRSLYSLGGIDAVDLYSDYVCKEVKNGRTEFKEKN